MSGTFSYIESIVLCILPMIVLHVFYVRDRKKTSFDFLSAVYFMFYIVAFMDALWVLVDGKKQFVMINKLSLFCYNLAISLAAYFWFCYTCVEIDKKFFASLKKQIICIIPVIISIILDIYSFFTGYVYAIDENFRYVRGEGFLLYEILIYSSFVSASVHSLVEAFKVKTINVKKKFFVQAFYVVPPILVSIYQILLGRDAFILYYGLICSMSMVFVNGIYSRITLDDLTHIPNYYTMDKILNEAIDKYKKTGFKNNWLVACDLDDFKSINDTCGHSTGDEALTIAASIFEKRAKANDGYVGRIHGDEFIMILENLDRKNVEEIMKGIENDMMLASKDKKYTLKTSYGIVECTENITVKEWFDKADEKLYENKASRKNKHLKKVVAL